MTPKKDKTAERETSTVVYCGPTIPGVAKRFTVYQNGLPAQLEEKAAAIPEIRGLLISMPDLPDAMHHLRVETGRIYRLYQLVQAKL